MNEILTEAWKEAYKIYLEEEEKAIDRDIDTLFEELTVAQAESKKALDILKEYYDIMVLTETPTKPENGDGKPAGTGGSANDKKNATGELSAKKNDGNININFGSNNAVTEPGGLKDSLANLFAVLNSGTTDKGMDYSPTAVFTNQSVKDMAFPENIIFFIGQLLKWIKNVVLFFVAKFINLIRRLTVSSNPQIDVKFPGLDLTRPKEMENIVKSVSLANTPSKVNLVKLDGDEVGILDRMLRENYVLSEACFNEAGREVLVPGIFDDILKTKKDLNDAGGGDGKSNFGPKANYAVSIDFSRDIEDLRTLIQHFYDLFDEAYGSNSEKLFDTQDLEVILELIKNQLERIKNGKAAETFTLGGKAAEIEAVNVYKVRDNLVLTNSNITALKEAYSRTAAKIRDIATVINGKEMLALSQFGIQYKLLTKSTIIAMKSILDSLPKRIRQAKNMERGLIKMKKAYEKVVKSLEASQRAIIGVSSIVFTSPYQKQINDLLSSTRFMSDIITLRLSGIGLYLRELIETRNIIKALAGLNGRK